MNGVFVVDKPEGLTSHEVVQTIRRMFGTAKVGHLGTLDPIATGVLPVCVGKATRIAQYIPGFPKEYEGEIRFGFSTDTYDREGTPTSEFKPLERTAEDICDAMRSLTGSIDQVAPAFSAKKLGGVPAYKRARKNQTVSIPPSRIEVQQFEMTALGPSSFTFKVICSPGTYVRSLVHDLGQRLGCGAHLGALRRLRSGPFGIEGAVKLDRISARDLIPPDRVLESMPRIEISEDEVRKVMHGNQVPAGVEGQFARIFNKKGEFIAVAAIENGWARPRVVLTSIASNQHAVPGCSLEKEIES